jgi:hypothetical protein
MIERNEEGQAVALYLPATPARPLPKFQRGDRVTVFDAAAWIPVGDVGDNSCFRKQATVLRFYQKGGDYLVDVLLDDGRVSRAHFANGVHKAT